MDRLFFLIKPASGRCNLKCRYCFYEDETTHRDTPDYGFLSPETTETLIREALAFGASQVNFAFQGGEPMVRGLDYFRSFTALVERYRTPKCAVFYSIQTNGTLVDQAWADFFREHQFLVGLSLDGTREVHNAHRVDALGKGSWDRVTRALALLQRSGVEVNLLCVVTGQIARRPQAVYQSMKKLGCRYLQFIPCLDPLGEERGCRPWSLTPEGYGKFLCTLFDLWYRDWERGDYVSIRTLDDYVHLLAGQPAGACATAGQCGNYLVVEGDGSVYPCDFFALDEWCLGRLGESSLTELLASPVGTRFVTEGRRAPEECAGCSWLALCGGGCRRDWVGTRRNYLCPAFRTFFDYAGPRLVRLARLERALTEGSR